MRRGGQLWRLLGHVEYWGDQTITWNFVSRIGLTSNSHEVTAKVTKCNDHYKIELFGQQAQNVIEKVNSLLRGPTLRKEKKRFHQRNRRTSRRSPKALRNHGPAPIQKKKLRKTTLRVVSEKNIPVRRQYSSHEIRWGDVVGFVRSVFDVTEIFTDTSWGLSPTQIISKELFGSLERTKYVVNPNEKVRRKRVTNYREAHFSRLGFTITFRVVGPWLGLNTRMEIWAPKCSHDKLYRRLRTQLRTQFRQVA